jgi:hypothetical protein
MRDGEPDRKAARGEKNEEPDVKCQDPNLRKPAAPQGKRRRRGMIEAEAGKGAERQSIV